MPKSISIPLFISLFLTFIVGILDCYKNGGATLATIPSKNTMISSYVPDKELLLSTFSQAFSLTTIVAFFLVLHFSEKSTPAAFGKVVRDNLSTIIVALATSAVFGTIELVSILGKFVLF